MLKFVEEFQRDDSEDDQASREEPNVSEGCRKAFIDDFFRTSSTGMLFHLSHVWAAIAFAAGLSIYIEINTRNHQRKKVIKK